MRTCGVCDTVVPDKGPCPTCMGNLVSKAKPGTKAGRQTELIRLLTNKNGAEVPWPFLKQRIAKLIGVAPEDAETISDNDIRIGDFVDRA